MGLANQKGNQVTLSYRSERFSRIKERNAKRIEDCIRSGKVKVLFNSNPLEFKPESVILEVAGAKQEIPNDFVWIFAGGTPPNTFRKKIGVGFATQDVTLAANHLLACVVPGRVERSPPLSEPLAVWLSIIAVVGLASRPALSRTST